MNALITEAGVPLPFHDVLVSSTRPESICSLRVISRTRRGFARHRFKYTRDPIGILFNQDPITRLILFPPPPCDGTQYPRISLVILYEVFSRVYYNNKL